MYSGIDHRQQAMKALLKKFGFRLYEVSKQQDRPRFCPATTAKLAAVQAHSSGPDSDASAVQAPERNIVLKHCLCSLLVSNGSRATAA